MLSTDALEDRFLAFRTTRDVQAMLALAVQTGDADLDALSVPAAAVAGFADVGLRPIYGVGWMQRRQSTAWRVCGLRRLSDRDGSLPSSCWQRSTRGRK